MAETNAKKRLWVLHTDHLPQVADGGLAQLGVPGTITDKQTIKVCRRQQHKEPTVISCVKQRQRPEEAAFSSGCPTCAVQRVVPGYKGDAGAPLSQAADLVVLDATVHHCDPHTSTGVENSGLLGTKAKETV